MKNEDLKNVAKGTYAKVCSKMDELKAADSITEIFTLFKRCNKYIDETEPWVLAKDDAKKDRLATVLYNLTESITIGASLLWPFLPATSEKIVAQLGTTLRDYDKLSEFGLYENGTKVTEKPEILFARLDINDVYAEAARIAAIQKAEAGVTEEVQKEEKAIEVKVKDEITYDDFAKLQFVVGEIVKCEEVPKSKKLLCSQVKIGNMTRQIVSGIKQYYKPEEMVGKKVMVLLNLKPATLAGVVSEGMLLCAEDEEGNLALVSPEKEMPSGALIC